LFLSLLKFLKLRPILIIKHQH